MLQWDLHLFEPNLYKIQIFGNHLYLLGTCVRVLGGGACLSVWVCHHLLHVGLSQPKIAH